MRFNGILIQVWVWVGLTSLCYGGVPKREILSCPLPKPEYDRVLSRLARFKMELLAPEKCRSLEGELSDLGVFYSSKERDIILALTNGHEEVSEITPEQATTLIAYSDKLSKKVSSIIDSLQRNPDCVAESAKPSILNSLANITQEVTGVAAAYSGPYGVPISLGGAIFGGILKGIDMILSSSKSYDFNNPEHRGLFVRSLCIYHDIKREVDGVLDPESRMAVLATLEQELTIKKGKLERISPGACKEYLDFRASRESVMKSVSEAESLLASLSTASVERCSQLAGAAHGSDSPFQKLLNQLEADFSAADCRPEPVNELTSLLLYAQSEEGVLTRMECFESQESGKLDSENRRSFGILSEILRLTRAHYDHTISHMVESAAPIYDSDHVPLNPVMWLRGTLARIDWAEQEIRRLKALLGSGSHSARREIVELEQYFQQRIFHELSPKFLAFLVGDAEDSLEMYQDQREEAEDSLEELVTLQVGSLSREERRILSDEPTRMARLLSMLESDPRLERVDHGYVYSLISELVPPLDRARYSVGATKEYCDYFSKAGTKSDPIRDVCEGSRLFSARESLESAAIEASASLLSYLSWAQENRKIQADSVKWMIETIKACHAKLVVPE